jgi:hypothetical protein
VEAVMQGPGTGGPASEASRNYADYL